MRPRSAIVLVIAIALAAVACRDRAPPPTPAPSQEAAAAPDAAAPRPPYRSPTAGFQVRFPDDKAPEVESKAVAGAATRAMSRIFKVQYGSSAYVVAVHDTAKGATPADALAFAREAITTTTAATIDSEAPITIGGEPGLEVSASATTSGLAIRQRARFFVRDGRLYEALVVTPIWSKSAAIEDAFLASFAPDNAP